MQKQICTYLISLGISKRLLCYVLLFLGVALLFELPSLFKWLSHRRIDDLTMVMLAIGGLCVVVEIWVDWYRCKAESNFFESFSLDSFSTCVVPFRYDSPTIDDKLNRKSYAKLLLDKICATFYDRNKPADDGKGEGVTGTKSGAKDSFVIHIGEGYGQGKTSFLLMLKKEIYEQKNKMPVVCFDFKPWLCESERGIATEFFSLFQKEVGKVLPGLHRPISEYLKQILASATCEVSGFSFPIAKVIGPSLKEMHDKIRDGLYNIDRPVIVIIDDVDRLQSKELMMVLRLVRDTADFPNVYYIIAADMTHLRKMLEQEGIDYADAYLKKFFTFELLMPANESVSFKEMMGLVKGRFMELKGKENGEANTQAEWLAFVKRINQVPFIKEAFPNMREVNRFVNVFFFTLDSLGKEQINDIDFFDLFLLTIIKMLDIDYYVQLRDNTLSLLEVKKVEKDMLLEWKKELNVVWMRQNKEIEKTINNINEGEKNTTSKDEQSIPDIEETIEQTKVTTHQIVLTIMDELLGNATGNRGINSICRLNRYFTYFANTHASYMVSRLQVAKMLQEDEATYSKDLRKLFTFDEHNIHMEEEKTQMFISEFFDVLSHLSGFNEEDILQRVFIFIKLSYELGEYRLRNRQRIYPTLQVYERSNEVRILLFDALTMLYPFRSLETLLANHRLEPKRNTLLDICERNNHLNLMIVCVNCISDRMDSFLFDRNNVKDAYHKLTERVCKEYLYEPSVTLQKEDFEVIVSMLQTSYGREVWYEDIGVYMKKDVDYCLGVLGKVIDLDTQPMRWRYADLNKFISRDLCASLMEHYPKQKKVLNGVYGLLSNVIGV